MNKLAYIDALERALAGLPPEVQARTLAYYEQRFVDGVAAGRTEDDVGRELDTPSRIAMTLRANIRLEAAQAREAAARPMDKDGPRHTIGHGGGRLRLAVSALALAVFNLFMLVPALVYSALLFALYACTLAFYVAGIATTASGLAGVNELALDWPAAIVENTDGVGSRQVRVDIGAYGIQVHDDSPPEAGNEAGKDGALRITTDMDAASRVTQIAWGAAMIVGAILGFLALLVVSRISLRGLRRYLQMNLALLGGRHHA